MEKLVSIIMPVFNAGSFVEQAIQSVLNQAYFNWELLVINDGSTDDSLQRVQAFQDPRIHIFNQANRGVSAARNVGLEQMRGEFFCFLDADDVIPPNSIKSRLNVFKEDIGFVDGGVEFFNASMERSLGHWTPSTSGKVLKKLFRLDNSCFFGLTWMIKVKGGMQYRFDESLTHGEDLLFFMCIADSGRYSFTEDVVLQYRKNEASAMQNIRGLARGYSMLRDKMRALFPVDLALSDKLVYDYKVRKIIFLTFFRANQKLPAMRYLFSGRL